MKTINLVYNGMAGAGRTVQEAKQDAARRIEKVLALNFTPSAFTWAGRTAIVWNTPFGVCSAYLQDDGVLGGVCHHSSFDIGAACQSVRLSLAQIGADIGSDDLPRIISGDAGSARAYYSWLGFQRAYRHAKTNHHDGTDTAWHKYACENSERFNPKAGAWGIRWVDPRGGLNSTNHERQNDENCTV